MDEQRGGGWTSKCMDWWDVLSVIPQAANQIGKLKTDEQVEEFKTKPKLGADAKVPPSWPP